MAAAVEQGFIAGLAPNEIAVVEVGRLVLGPIGAVALLIGGLLATASSANASILASSRINFAMGRDRIVTPELNEIHPRFGTPYRAIGITGALILVFIAVAPIETLASMGSVLHLVIYGLLNIALIVFRESNVEDYDPSYEVPLYPITPIVGTLVSFALIAFIAPVVIALSAVLVVGAVLWYLLYARSRTTRQGVLSEYILSRADRMPDTAVSAAASVQPDGGQYRVMVPLANPENETDLISLASAVAKGRGGTVDAVHIVTVPDQTALQYAADHLEEHEEDYHAVLDAAKADAETFGVDIETHTIVSHRGVEEIFDAARTHNADMVVMGWGPGGGSRAESGIDEITGDIPCDFLVLKDRGFDPDRVLVPTAGGPDSDLSAAVANHLRREFGSTVTLLHVAEDREAGEAFLEEWAAEHDLADAELRVETGDVETAIERAAEDATTVIFGATERGLLRRLVSGSLVMDVVDDVGCSVLLAERARKRSLRERLFGLGREQK
jgi:nucleotide-binding universal stress UspA family protein